MTKTSLPNNINNQGPVLSPSLPSELQTSRIVAIAKSMMGSIFEWYQFCIYGYFAPIIGKVFFPMQSDHQNLLMAYGIFFAGYLARPIGGLLFGSMGDRFGRKCVLVWTLLLMAIPTTIIGILPSYEKIGIWSSLLLIICRIVQGLSMGGNYGGSITFIFEQSSQKRQGFSSSFSVISVLIGLLLGSLTLWGFNAYLSADFIETVGFRIPFLLGVGVIFWSWMLHKTLPESPVFEAEKATGTKERKPLKMLFEHYQKSLFLLVGTVTLHDLSFYILFVFMMTYFTEKLGVSKELIFAINSFSILLVACSVLFFAWLSDFIGRKIIMKGAALFFIVTTIPLVDIMTSPGVSTIWLLGCNAILAIGAGAFLGPMPSLMVETFPSSIRSSGITTTGNICGPLFGGSAPFILTYLTTLTGIHLIPAFYLTLSAVIAFICLIYLPSHVQNNR